MCSALKKSTAVRPRVLPEGRGDVRGRQHRRCNLVQQRLEQVVVATVDQDDIGVGALQRAGRGDAGESPPTMTTRLRREPAVCGCVGMGLVVPVMSCLGFRGHASAQPTPLRLP